MSPFKDFIRLILSLKPDNPLLKLGFFLDLFNLDTGDGNIEAQLQRASFFRVYDTRSLYMERLINNYPILGFAFIASLFITASIMENIL